MFFACRSFEMTAVGRESVVLFVMSVAGGLPKDPVRCFGSRSTANYVESLLEVSSSFLQCVCLIFEGLRRDVMEGRWGIASIGIPFPNQAHPNWEKWITFSMPL